MKLFVFEHCPYCIKAMMVAGLKNLAVEEVFLQNHDVDARIEKVGANMVPILEKPDGSYMAESLDIAQYLDDSNGSPVITEAKFGDKISGWLGQSFEFSGPLLYPRWLMIELPEYGSEDAKAWFTKNKSAMIGMSFEEAYAKTDEYLAKMNAHLEQLEWLTLPSERGNAISYDDVNLYPHLRNLTVVKGIQFPTHVRQYIDEVTKLTKIRLFDAVAV
ncbi:glutaredoxin 2 [Vibrio nigripulchritudo]|uniref:Glutaredoxin, GrxB n=1 Tax=Vibrio nigripulchritudo SOn1 TaxID=1238450 RepID=A0AAV2VRK1_9VIBR|nr:glutaredoxin 2 [Vibrio nigripulchritudo]CCN72189.1 putative Glutaredoxin, GrxB [Vibrio nigripulchritudo SFn118]CCO47355.1 putative Glutaredoxin, GrxB [Vibrio nigripulchritudo SOn1]